MAAGTDLDLLAERLGLVGRLPEAEVVVLADRDALAGVGAQGHAVDGLLMVGEGHQRLLGGDVPVGSGRQLPVAPVRLEPPQRHLHGVDVAAMAIQHHQPTIAVFQKRPQDLADHVHVRIHTDGQGRPETQVMMAGAQPLGWQ